MITSGLSALSTTTDAPLLLFDATASPVTRIVVVNYGLIQGFFSVDNGATWAILPAGTSSGPSSVAITVGLYGPLLVKRIAAGTNLTGLYAFGY